MLLHSPRPQPSTNTDVLPTSSVNSALAMGERVVGERAVGSDSPFKIYQRHIGALLRDEILRYFSASQGTVSETSAQSVVTGTERKDISILRLSATEADDNLSTALSSFSLTNVHINPKEHTVTPKAATEGSFDVVLLDATIVAKLSRRALSALISRMIPRLHPSGIFYVLPPPSAMNPELDALYPERRALTEQRRLEGVLSHLELSPRSHSSEFHVPFPNTAEGETLREKLIESRLSRALSSPPPLSALSGEEMADITLQALEETALPCRASIVSAHLPIGAIEDDSLLSRAFGRDARNVRMALRAILERGESSHLRPIAEGSFENKTPNFLGEPSEIEREQATSLDQYMSRNSAMLTTALYTYSADWHLAEDCAQAAYIKARRRIAQGTFGEIRDVGRFLYITGRNELVDQVRRLRKWQSKAVDVALDDHRAEDSASTDRRLIKIYLDAADAAVGLNKGQRKATERHAQHLLLTYLYDLSGSDIMDLRSKVFGEELSLPSVHMAISRARSSLLEALQLAKERG